MPKTEWGVKRTCLGCGARFYDLMRDPIVCPKCDAELDITVAQKPRRAKPAAAAKAAAKAAVKKTDDLIDDADIDADADADADRTSDDTVLETDDDDGDVIVAKGTGNDEDSESIDENVLLDGTDDNDDNDADEDAADEDGDPGDAKTGGDKSKDN
ncbi:MAG: FYDLN acid domain-containing protein [Limibaculum sp.]